MGALLMVVFLSSFLNIEVEGETQALPLAVKGGNVGEQELSYDDCMSAGVLLPWRRFALLLQSIASDKIATGPLPENQDALALRIYEVGGDLAAYDGVSVVISLSTQHHLQGLLLHLDDGGLSERIPLRDERFGMLYKVLVWRPTVPPAYQSAVVFGTPSTVFKLHSKPYKTEMVVCS